MLLKQCRETIFQVLGVALLLRNKIASGRYMRVTHLLGKISLIFASVANHIGTMSNEMVEGSGQEKSASCVQCLF